MVAVAWWSQRIHFWIYAAGDKISPLPGLGLINGSCTPHDDDGEANRRSDFQRLIENGELPAGIGIDDGAAILFAG